MQTYDRLIDFVTSGASLSAAPAAPRPRTAAQVEASRRNGAKSRGPRTAAGKARVRANAWRSGLFAKRLRPFDDGGYEHHDYDELLRHLVAEHRPAGQVQQLLVETLAADLIHLRRVLELRGVAFAAEAVDFTPNPSARDQGLETMEDTLRRLDGLVDAFERGVPISMPADNVAETAAYFAGLARELGDAAATPQEGEGAESSDQVDELLDDDDDDEDLDWVDPFGPLSREELCRAYAAVGPEQLGLTDEVHVAEVLSSRRPVADAQRPQWSAFLRHARRDWERCVGRQRREVGRYDDARREGQGDLLANLAEPAEILTVERRARQSIEHTLRLLNGLRYVGRGR